MSTRLSRRIVRIAVAVIADPGTRDRYREQWLADVDGAADLGMSPLPVAMGAASAAVRLAAVDRRLVGASFLSGISDSTRRAYGAILLLCAAPYLWGVGFYWYARLRLGVSHGMLRNHDPKDLVDWWLPVTWPQLPSMLWIAFGGWLVAAALAPFGLVIGLGGRRAGRWLPLAGCAAAVAAVAVAHSAFGADLRIWLLD